MCSLSLFSGTFSTWLESSTCSTPGRPIHVELTPLPRGQSRQRGIVFVHTASEPRPIIQGAVHAQIKAEELSPAQQAGCRATQAPIRAAAPNSDVAAQFAPDPCHKAMCWNTMPLGLRYPDLQEPANSDGRFSPSAATLTLFQARLPNELE